MLPKSYRLSLKGQWPKIKKEGQIFTSPLFSLIVSHQPSAISHQPLTRFGFIVSNKISKKATVRNRIKRLFREAVQSFLPQIKPGFFVVFSGKQTLVGKSLPQIKEEMKKFFKKSQLIN